MENKKQTFECHYYGNEEFNCPNHQEDKSRFYRINAYDGFATWCIQQDSSKSKFIYKEAQYKEEPIRSLLEKENSDWGSVGNLRFLVSSIQENKKEINENNEEK